MDAPSHTTSPPHMKPETKLLPSLPPARLSFTSASHGLMVLTAMPVLISLPNPTTPVWAGPSKATATEQSLQLPPLLFTPPLRNADGTMELRPSPLRTGLRAISPLTLPELVFARMKGFTNARVTLTAFGARWLPMNQKRLFTGRMPGLGLATALTPWLQRPVQVCHQRRAHLNHQQRVLLRVHLNHQLRVLLRVHLNHQPRVLLRVHRNPLPRHLLLLCKFGVGNSVRF
jgi:hypothetical protein